MEKVIENINHNIYLEEQKRIEIFKSNVKRGYKACKMPLLKKIYAMFLVEKLSRVQFSLEENRLRELSSKEETWNCDYLEYNINKIYTYILREGIKRTTVKLSELIEHTGVEYERTPFLFMSAELRASKERNPEIVLESDIFEYPFIVNGNHRMRAAYKKGASNMDVYVVQADDVVDCLVSDGYKTAYHILKKLNRLFPLRLHQ